MLRAYAAVPGTMPWVAKASANARSRMPPSSTATPSRPQHSSVTGVALLTRTPVCGPTLARAGPRLVVARGRLSPQVELSAVGLDLPPQGKNAQPGQGEQKQLLHGADPFTSTFPEPGPGRVGRAPCAPCSLAAPGPAQPGRAARSVTGGGPPASRPTPGGLPHTPRRPTRTPGTGRTTWRTTGRG